MTKREQLIRKLKQADKAVQKSGKEKYFDEMIDEVIGDDDLTNPALTELLENTAELTDWQLERLTKILSQRGIVK